MNNYQPIATIPSDEFVQITDFPNNPLAATIRIAQMRSVGGLQIIGSTPPGGVNAWKRV